MWQGEEMKIKTVKMKANWTDTLSNKGWDAFFHWPKKFKSGDEVLVAGSSAYGPLNAVHTIIKVAYILENGEIVYKVRRPNDNTIRMNSSTYLIKPRALKRIISLYCSTDKPTNRIISVDEGHGTLNYDRICKTCGSKGTILCDGGFETCINKNCKSHHEHRGRE